MANRIPLTVRFWEKVHRLGPDDCWSWLGARDAGGYGRINVDGAGVVAHRVAYELEVGTIPDGLHLDHLCRNRACVNPTHLEPVTCAENVRRGHFANVSQCPQGHEYDNENTYRYTDQLGRTRRACRTCKRERQRSSA